MKKAEFIFDEKVDFLVKLRELVDAGIDRKKIRVITPVPVHEIDDILGTHPHRSKIKYFTLIGALTGFTAGYALTIYTHLSWESPPLIVGGKPLVSVIPFFVIAYELTILFGGIATFIGLLILSGLPSIKKIISPEDYGNKFVIQVFDEKVESLKDLSVAAEEEA